MARPRGTQLGNRRNGRGMQCMHAPSVCFHLAEAGGLARVGAPMVLQGRQRAATHACMSCRPVKQRACNQLGLREGGGCGRRPVAPHCLTLLVMHDVQPTIRRFVYCKPRVYRTCV